MQVTRGKGICINITGTPQTHDQLGLELIEGMDFGTTLKPSTKCCKQLMLNKFSAASPEVPREPERENSWSNIGDSGAMQKNVQGLIRTQFERVLGTGHAWSLLPEYEALKQESEMNPADFLSVWFSQLQGSLVSQEFGGYEERQVYEN